MKTMPPSLLLTLLARSLTLLALGCSCIALAWKRKARLNRLFLNATRRLTQAQIFTEEQVPTAPQVALVPGASICGSLLRERVEAAAKLYHAGIVSHLILSGDGRSPDYHEPHAMRFMLRSLGVPDRVMTEDPAGLSTYESIKRGGCIAAGHRMVIVTQQLYCGRSLLLARGQGVDAIACAIPSLPSAASIQREELACVRAVIDLAGLLQWTESLERRTNAHLNGHLRTSIQG